MREDAERGAAVTDDVEWAEPAAQASRSRTVDAEHSPAAGAATKAGEVGGGPHDPVEAPVTAGLAPAAPEGVRASRRGRRRCRTARSSTSSTRSGRSHDERREVRDASAMTTDQPTPPTGDAIDAMARRLPRRACPRVRVDGWRSPVRPRACRGLRQLSALGALCRRVRARRRHARRTRQARHAHYDARVFDDCRPERPTARGAGGTPRRLVRHPRGPVTGGAECEVAP